MKDILLISLIGIIAGLFNGITGFGSSVIMAQGLLLLNMYNYESMLGTLLYTSIFPTTLFSVYYFYQKDQINFTHGNILTVMLIIFTLVGSYFIKYINKDNIIIYNGIFMILVGLCLICKSCFNNILI